MKWLGEGDSEMLSQSNGPQQVQQQASSQQVNAESSRPQVLSRSQDDAMVGYVFQRPQADPDFPVPPTFKQQSRWPVTDDTVIDHPGSEHFLYHHMTQPPPPMTGVLPPDMHSRNGQIAPSAKKLWGVDEPKDEPKGILSLNDHQNMWRDSTWSTSDHAVSQPITMVARRSGSFPGSEAGNILSPRSSETSGLGVKMVEYVLGTSPTNKDLEPQMRRLVLTSNDPNDKKEKEKAPSSPYDTAQKKEHENGVVPQNGVQNGLDDDKGFNRTPGSRQPSPSDEELNKNNGVVVLENPHSHVGHHYPHPFPPPPHPHTLAHLDSHFEHVMALDPNSFTADGSQQQGYSTQTPQQPQQHTQTQAMDSPTVLSTSFDVQQLFRNQNTAVNPAQQIQLLQQQQYQHLATQQQQQLAGLAPAPGATFAPAAPYIINPQEPPYVIATGPTVMPQYYSVPWGVYPANIIQQGTTTQQRRPLTPSSASENPSNLPQVQPGQYQVIPTAYYDQNGSMVIRGINTAPQTMRLVSPAPVLVNAGTPGSSMRLLGSQTQQITTPPSSIYSGTQPASLYSTPTANGTTISGLPPQSGSAAPGYSTNLASLTSSLSSLGAGLGLSTGSTGRRDSFDRNTSAFSPSLEYGRQKWPQNYGALGTVTASPSPLGLASGSVSPPPALGSSAGLQLGALTTSANRSLLSAAPGAEAMTKFRASTTMLGTNSLFAKLGTVPRSLGQTSTSPLEAKPTGRSRLLEDFRNNRYPSLQLRDLTNHIVEFSQDQHGSRFIQQKLERATVPEKQLVFSEIIAAAYNLMTDVFGNYVIQKFFEFGTADQKTTLAQKVRGHVLPLALQMYGCRVIQKALESISGEQQVEIVRELDGHVLKCVKDQNGNHVVQKCIECVDPHALQFIINAFQGQVFALSTHPYGCRVIQRILEHCTPEQTAPILEELHQHTDQLIQDQYGNYVIQHVLEHGKPEDKSLLIGAVRGKVLALSQHKFASNVVEKCVTHATRAERAFLIEEVCGFNDNALHVMMKDQYANYVVQKMLDVCEASQRKVLMHKIRPHFASLRKYTYGKHIIAKLEKFFMKSNNVVPDLGPIGPPTNGVL
ncbi:pumilio homolog 2 isoform X4 [Macrosteles quadrilineatus]|uniref:pumilio homolog 2 isoform X4 n=1 Tax=Macrosteles quadrilineatus TaxID=74068 RepID=UPI0023E2F4A9|nr:pumilio homolog 2 isoform X4 [Macrosteles quadrilineatus]